jgi:DNA-binding MarR family transcriptional regulator
MTKTSDHPGEAILTLLADRPDLSPAEVAIAVGIGHSTAAKRLAALEQAGKVRRRAGGRQGSRRLPDHWLIVLPKTAPAKSTPRVEVRSLPDPERSDPNRLGRGQLVQLVLAELAANPDEPVGPARVAKALGRSSGAVSNALERLVGTGEAALVDTSPRRYQMADPGRTGATRGAGGAANRLRVPNRSKNS